DLDKAIYYYERANSLSPDDENIKWLLKKVERVKEVGKEAYEYFEEGRKLHLNADYANAAFYLEHAVGINPSYLEALVLLGKSYMRIGELKKAEDAFSKAKVIDPTNYELELLLDEVKNKIK
ncbi:MAG TPA: tetratricopeptide repeat protein, partial [Candidatus Atribacteria bacterium]|nr:tetratricopeptide repeat protein [Candidatus Atribacteria bacterium]